VSGKAASAYSACAALAALGLEEVADGEFEAAGFFEGQGREGEAVFEAERAEG
jgi:hypothetical protein